MKVATKYLYLILILSLFGGVLLDYINRHLLYVDKTEEFSDAISHAFLFSLVCIIYDLLASWILKRQLYLYLIGAALFPGLVYFAFALTVGFDFKGTLLVILSIGLPFSMMLYIARIILKD